MPLYKMGNPAELAQNAMNSATQAAASQTKQTGTRTEKETSVWDDVYKGAAAIASVGRGLNSITNAIEGAWDLHDRYKLRDAYDNVDKAFSEGGFEAIQANPDMQDYWHSKAFGQLMLDRANNEKGRLEMMKNMDAVADKQYQDWRIQAMGTRKAFSEGNMEQFDPLMQQLSKSSPLPYQLEPTGDGNFKVMFRSDEKGGWADTGRTMTREDALSEVDKVLRGEQSVLRGVDGKLHPVNQAFNRAAAKSYFITQMGNAESRVDPKKQIPLYNSEGKQAGIGVIQNPLNDYSIGPQLVVFGSEGKQVGVFDGFDGAIRAGYSPVKPSKDANASGGTGAGARGYRPTKGDIDILTKYATAESETGEKVVDYGKAAFLEQMVRGTGLSPLQAIGAFEQNVNNAMKQGASRAQAENATMNILSQKLSGAQQGTQAAPAQARPAPGANGNTQAAQGNVSPTTKNRIINASNGSTGQLGGIGVDIPLEAQIRPPASERLKKWQNTTNQ